MRRFLFKLYFRSMLVLLLPVYLFGCFLADSINLEEYYRAFRDADMFYDEIR